MTQEVESTEGAGAPNTEVKSYSEAEFREMLEKETQGLKSKVDELLGEKKTASQRAREAQEMAAREKEERAKKENDYESLFKSSQEKTKEWEEKYNGLAQKIKGEKIANASLKLSSEMASGPNSDLLSAFIERRLDVSEDGELMVLSEDGKPTVSTMADLKKEFEQSGRFDALLDATKASGGGATKSKSGGAGFNGKKLSEMTKDQKLEYFRQKKGM
jgi:hypothetical protein